MHLLILSILFNIQTQVWNLSIERQIYSHSLSLSKIQKQNSSWSQKVLSNCFSIRLQYFWSAGNFLGSLCDKLRIKNAWKISPFHLFFILYYFQWECNSWETSEHLLLFSFKYISSKNQLQNFSK